MTLTTPQQAQVWLAAHGPACWRSWDAPALEAACAVVPVQALAEWPDVARWRALAALMREQADALAALELAWRGHVAQGRLAQAGVDAHMALALCLIDIGAMDQVTGWLERARGDAGPAGPEDGALWLHLGRLARAVLAPEEPLDTAAAQAWLQAQLQPLAHTLAPDEKLIAALVLVNFHFAQQRYEQFDLIATQVEEPAAFDSASPLMRSRWCYTVGFAHYQLGAAERAELHWQRSLALAGDHGLPNTRLMASLAMLRLLLDRGRLDEAEEIERGVQPQWGAGRTTQLIELQQMRARLQLLRHQPVRAQATLREALALAEQSGLSMPERASCLTDFAQALVANNHHAEAGELLERLVRDHAGRDGEVYRCLHALLGAWQARDADPHASRAQLADALTRAQQVRYTMFFRLLPRLAAQLCALALRWQVEPVFVREVIRSRTLAAPADADEHWPWALWLRLLGGFELHLHGDQPLPRSGKQQQKPLELLRLLGCARSLSVSAAAAGVALWPEADPAAARKNLEVTVQRLRRLLGDDTLVRVGNGHVALDAARASSDVAQRRVLIERLQHLAMLPRATEAQALALHHEAATLVARIVASHAGPLLPGAAEAPWLLTARERCEREMTRAAHAATVVMESASVPSGPRRLLEAALRDLER